MFRRLITYDVEIRKRRSGKVESTMQLWAISAEAAVKTVRKMYSLRFKVSGNNVFNLNNKVLVIKERKN
jgi:hypothetical protein